MSLNRMMLTCVSAFSSLLCTYTTQEEKINERLHEKTLQELNAARNRGDELLKERNYLQDQIQSIAEELEVQSKQAQR